MFTMSESKDQVTVQASTVDEPARANSSAQSLPKDDAVAVAQSSSREEETDRPEQPADQIDEQKKGRLAYFKTKEFYIVLVLG
jgi:solute carrier family 35 protein F1/2